MSNKITTPEVGMGVTVCGYSDRTAWTITRISKTGKCFWATQDMATLKDGWKPEFVPGGFAGHCTNQGSQEYNYKSNPDGYEVRFTKTKDGGWSSKQHGRRVILGVRSYFYDYNF
jgi:hypothetical protein